MWYIIDKTNKGATTMRKELLKGLSEEQIKKVEACKSSEEILELAKAEGVELNDEQLEAVSGGGCFDGFKKRKCPECGSSDLDVYGSEKVSGHEYTKLECKKCGNKWRM